MATIPSRIYQLLDLILTAATNLAVRVGVLESGQGDALTLGVSTMPRGQAASGASQTLSNQSLRLSYFTSTKSFTSTQVKFVSGATAAAATPTLVRLALYSIAANGDATLVASTVSDTALFATINTSYTRSWSVPVALVAGQRYAVAGLCVTGAAAPSLAGQLFFNGSGAGGTEAGQVAPRLSGFVAGQADLPASFAAGSITDLGSRAYVAILP